MEGSLPLGFATLDLDRLDRQGLPEVVYGPGKQPAQITQIALALLDRSSGPVLVTRVEPETAAQILAAVSDLQGDRRPGSAGDPGAGDPGAGDPGAGDPGADHRGMHAPGRRHLGTYDAGARLLCWRPEPPGGLTVAVVTAGTADGPVADEAAAVARAVGLLVSEYRDVGIAGLHRLLSVAADIRAADVVIVVAGMEGALASAVAGLVGSPVVAVPTSTGYGAALEGVTALLAMMTSCAAGVCVVNIDSGFGAAMAAHRLAFALARRASRSPAPRLADGG
jgi:pyridinium-3,5-biscarboxylic acid mononucleotide synthase